MLLPHISTSRWVHMTNCCCRRRVRAGSLVSLATTGADELSHALICAGEDGIAHMSSQTLYTGCSCHLPLGEAVGASDAVDAAIAEHEEARQISSLRHSDLRDFFLVKLNHWMSHSESSSSICWQSTMQPFHLGTKTEERPILLRWRS